LPEKQKKVIVLQTANFFFLGKSGKNQCKVQAYIDIGLHLALG